MDLNGPNPSKISPITVFKTIHSLRILRASYVQRLYLETEGLFTPTLTCLFVSITLQRTCQRRCEEVLRGSVKEAATFNLLGFSAGTGGARRFISLCVRGAGRWGCVSACVKKAICCGFNYFFLWFDFFFSLIKRYLPVTLVCGRL